MAGEHDAARSLSGPTWAALVVTEVTDRFERAADAGRARDMAAYMRDQFTFLGIPAPERRAILREVVAPLGPPSSADLADVGRRCWAADPREMQYAACWVLRRWTRRRGADDLLPEVAALITHRSWWDTVDELARVVGDLAATHPALVPTVESWAHADDRWLARVSILHQLGWGDDLDVDRLRRACRARIDDTDPFLRKAIGWALRDASRRHPDEVVAFVAEHRDELSGLSRREALKALVRAGDPRAVALDG